MAIEYFTPQWQRPRRKNDVIPPASSSTKFWHRYSCLICDKSTQKPLRCSRCKSTVYCSIGCQKHDFGEGKHKSHCLAVDKLWEEKSRLEKSLWYEVDDGDGDDGGGSTNPFDDDYVHPEKATKQEEAKATTSMCNNRSILERSTNSTIAKTNYSILRDVTATDSTAGKSGVMAHKSNDYQLPSQDRSSQSPLSRIGNRSIIHSTVSGWE